MRLETKRLILREVTPEDAPVLQRLSMEESTRREMYDEDCATVEIAREFITELRRHYADLSLPYALAVARKEGGAMIGHVSLSPCDGEIEIGYAIAESERGHGYASEAADAFAAWALEQLRLPAVLGVVRVGNEGSCRVLEKAGFQLDGKELRPCFGGVHEAWIYHRKGENV